MSKRRCTAEETLLTFWPPAPCARIALISISASGIAIAEEGLAMVLYSALTGRAAENPRPQAASCAPRPRPLT